MDYINRPRTCSVCYSTLCHCTLCSSSLAVLRNDFLHRLGKHLASILQLLRRHVQSRNETYDLIDARRQNHHALLQAPLRDEGCKLGYGGRSIGRRRRREGGRGKLNTDHETTAADVDDVRRYGGIGSEGFETCEEFGRAEARVRTVLHNLTKGNCTVR